MTVKNKRNDSKVLIDATDDKRFFCNDGCIIKNLAELSICLTHISQESFEHHVNSTKNDFSNWIRDVLGDKQLAEDLVEIMKPKEASQIIKERLASLRKKSG
jgi:hypothetical protein